MEYVAKHYIKVDGRMICPGELFQKEYDAEAERRLIEAGAIRKAGAQAPASTEQPETEKPDVADEEKRRESTREMYAAQLRAMGYGPDGMALPAESAEESAEDAEDTLDAEPPVMDVEDTVVTQTPAKKKSGGKKK